MATRLSTIATFVAGLVVGAGMVYLAPPAEPTGGPGGMPLAGGPPGGGGMMGPPPGAGVAGLPGDDVVPPPGGGNPEGAANAAPPGTSPEAAALSPPPPGAGPPDGAVGPPLPAGEQEAAPDGRAGTTAGATRAGGRRADWLELHVDHAAEFWTEQAKVVERSGHADAASFAERMRAIAKRVPARGELAPPLPQVVLLLDAELNLYDDMKAAGLDVSAVEVELKGLLDER